MSTVLPVDRPQSFTNPFRAAAHDYLASGWKGPLPVGSKSKPLNKSPAPKGFTGWDGEWPDTDQVDTWVKYRGSYNIALRLSPNVVGLDLDLYKGPGSAETMTAITEAHGELPPTWMSTSRSDGSGIRLFQLPDGVDAKKLDGSINHPSMDNQTAGEVIRHGHRYAVVWPSIHPDTGDQYEWTHQGTGETRIPSPTELQILPGQWVEHLKGACSCYAAKLTVRPTGDGAAAAVRARYNYWSAKLTSGSSRHDAGAGGSLALYSFDQQGWPSASELLERFHSDFLTAVTADKSRRPSEAEAEWGRMIEGAETKALSTSIPPFEQPRKVESQGQLDHNDPETGQRLAVRYANEVTMKRTRWVLDGWWPIGGLSILAGFGGLGKSTYVTHLAAQLTLGTAPGDLHGTPTKVLILTAEDVWSSTVVPRLRAAGADLSKIAFLAINTNEPDTEPVPGTINLPEDLPIIEELLEEGGFSFICLDPLVSFLDGDTDSHKDQSVRLVLDPLNLLAARHDIGILGNMHFNKSETKDPYKKLSSSAAFWDAARSVAFLGQEHGSSRTDPYRYLAAAKNNLAPKAQSIKYRIEEIRVAAKSGEESATTSKLTYVAPSEIEVHELFSGKREASERDDLTDDIRQLLYDNDGVILREEIEDIAENIHGVSKSTAVRAIKGAGARVFKPSGQTFTSKEWWVRAEWVDEKTATNVILSRNSSTEESDELEESDPTNHRPLWDDETESQNA